MDELLMVGVVTTTHGVRGEVKVFPTTDDADRFKKLKKVILFNEKEYKPLKIQSVKRFKQFVILKLEGCDTMDDALLLKNAQLFVTREDAVKCEEDEYFIADLIGMRVTDEEGKDLGTVDDVITTGANDVYEIKQDNGNSFLIPAIKECVLSVNVKEKKMTIHLMDGLL
ncbi:MAG: ribosome maturation factor RimM [Lachnospiraceae bacterium]|nr:ribosome maturation factor RimM [Lachnospiraceae bacterium]